MAHIRVYDKTTGEEAARLIPEHWLGNPLLGGNYARTKPTEAAMKAAATDAKAAAKAEKEN